METHALRLAPHLTSHRQRLRFHSPPGGLWVGLQPEGQRGDLLWLQRGSVPNLPLGVGTRWRQSSDDNRRVWMHLHWKWGCRPFYVEFYPPGHREHGRPTPPPTPTD